MNLALINFVYLIAAVLFVMGLKGLSHPRTAVRGNLLAAVGMAIAIFGTLTDQAIISYKMIIIGIAVGTIIGAVLAIKIQMTAMPQLVALFNAFGGGASTLVAGAALMEMLPIEMTMQFKIATVASGLIGTVTFFGSVVAWAKLQGVMGDRFSVFPGQHALNIFMSIASVGLCVYIVLFPEQAYMYWVLVGTSTFLGVIMIMRIGGADMPVIIALLNSLSGIAAAGAGFILNNNVLIVAGSLVGASGLILTQIMCKAMNRSIANVMFAPPQAMRVKKGDKEDIYAGKIKSTTAEELAMVLDTAQRVVVVPGYGLAVAQAQHTLRALGDMLAKRGTTVEYGIHPVAGRMPGHMNVLLAEADVPYEQLQEMDNINPTFAQTDVVLVIGANDVVNPLARTDPNCPIAGMPILNVDEARTVVVIKRSLSPGFAGLDNPLFAMDNTLMYFGDAKKAIQDLVESVKEL